MNDFDITIIGGGIVGLATAMYAQNKYPKKINRKSRKHLKPLEKKDSKYLDPRESNENMKIKDDKKENKKLDSDRPVKIKTKKPRKPKKAQN